MESEQNGVVFGDLMATPTRNGIYKGPAFQGRGVPVIKMGEVYKTDVVGDTDRDRLALTASELDRLEVLESDLLFCRTSLVALGVGHCAIVGRLSERTTFASNLIRVRLDPSKSSARFWFYYFRSPLGKEQLLTLARGTSVTTITGPDIAALRIPDLGLEEQRAIACILGALDDKIELNRRMNETLEGMARAIFKSWFVDFDPVWAKAAGQQPPGLAPHIADLFPDEFVESGLGEIPKGWRTGTLDQVIEIHDSKRIPLSRRERSKRQGSYPYYGAAGIIDYVDDYLFDGVYVLVGEDGSVVTDQGNPVVQYVWGKFWVNNHAHVLNGIAGVSDEHLMLLLKRVYLLPYVTGAVQPKLNQANMKAIPIVRAPTAINEAFGQTIEPLFAKFRLTHDQNTSLAVLRDTLLPKLISGELRVPDVERIVGRCV